MDAFTRFFANNLLSGIKSVRKEVIVFYKVFIVFR